VSSVCGVTALSLAALYFAAACVAPPQPMRQSSNCSNCGFPALCLRVRYQTPRFRSPLAFRAAAWGSPAMRAMRDCDWGSLAFGQSRACGVSDTVSVRSALRHRQPSRRNVAS
jgi:hypothetical protein